MARRGFELVGLVGMLFLSACGQGSGDRPVAAQQGAKETVAPVVDESAPHTITWVDEIRYSKLSWELRLGEIPAGLGDACNTSGFGQYWFTVYDEAGTAVSSEAQALAEPAPVTNTATDFVCRYNVTITVDDARRYRAERTAGNFEYPWSYPDVLEYSFIEKAALQSAQWTWRVNGGAKKA